MWKKIILLTVILALTALVGSTIYVNNIDWNKHKDKIAQQFSEATGKQVVFKGAVTLNVFPSTYLEVSDIEIYNPNAGTANDKVLLANIKKIVAQLSLRSLISGNFNVEKMNMFEPEIFVEQYKGGKINWHSDSAGQQNLAFENIEVSLDSLMVEKAKLHIKAAEYDVSTTLEDINAEIISQSLFGPYRIEGSYNKGGNPRGFAISLGQFSSNFATSVNAVLSHPQSDSYVRFDGTVLLQNDAINGNLVFESQNPVNFLNSTFGYKFSEEYEYPTAVAMLLKTDKSQVSVENIVIKYGMSVGAGNVLIPRMENKIGDKGMQRRRVDAVFNMTELQLDPLIFMARDFVKMYDNKKPYIPEYDFDVIADFKSVKTMYNNQVIRDFDLSVDFVDNVLKVQNLSATMPGETSAKIKGEISSIEKQMTYSFDVTTASNDFAKFASWLKVELDKPTDAIYKKAYFNSTVEGTLETIKVAPFDVSIDKTIASGKLGIVREKGEVKWFAIVNADTINFDNYVFDVPSNVKDGWNDKLVYRFGQLAKLNDVDLQFRFNLKSGIYGKTAFENLQTDAILKKGNLKINDFKVNNVATANLSLSGNMTGFGKSPEVKNLKYRLDVKENVAFVEKFNIPLENVNLRNLTASSLSGIITGFPNKMALRTQGKLGNIDFAYDGTIFKQNNVYNFNGKGELRAPDFVRFLNDISIDYKPDFPLGLLKITAELKGAAQTLLMKNIAANIGINAFDGDLVYAKKDGITQIKTDLKVNRFEIEKFFYNANKETKNSFRTEKEYAAFLSRPQLSLAKINYEWLKNLSIEGKFSVDSLLFNGAEVSDATWAMSIDKDIVKVVKFASKMGKGTLGLDAELNVPLNAKLTGKAVFKGIEINKDNWSGSIYGLLSGVYDVDMDFNTIALSEEDLLSQLSGRVDFSAQNVTVKGWDLNVIAEDLQSRDVAEGLLAMSQKALSNGETNFDTLKVSSQINMGSFFIKNALFSNNDTDVRFEAEGNLQKWTTKSSMFIDLRDNPQVSGFDFSLDGSISNPTLEVDTLRAAKVFDEKWEKIAQNAKAAEEAKVESYKVLMQKQQDVVDVSNKKLEMLLAKFESQNSIARDVKMKDQYLSIKKQIDAAEMLVDDITSKADASNIDDAIIEKLTKDNATLSKTLAWVEKDLVRVHSRDVKLRINVDYNSIFEIYNQSKVLASSQIDLIGSFDKRLAAINTSFNTRKNPQLDEWKVKLAESVLAIDAVNSDMSKQNVEAQSVENIDDLEAYSAKLVKNLDDAEAELANMKKILSDMESYLDKNVKAAEAEYIARIKEEEVRKKLEENVGKISTSTGRKIMVERDIVEIEQSEEAVKNQDIKILDFSEELRLDTPSGSSSTTVSGTIKRN